MRKSSSPSPIILRVLLVLPLLLGTTTRVAGHTRLECPPPLSGETGEKVGPCDVATDDGSMIAFPLKANALNTVTWLESLAHPGAPARFALSRDGEKDGFETCLLLDHVPHDALSRPTFKDELTWHRSSITLWIPDVKCERCYLQLISVMSDAIHGVPEDTKCAYQGALAANTDDEAMQELPACPVVYHSCSPVSIDGSIPRNEVDFCNTSEYEEKLEWPLRPADNPELYEHSIYYNRGDVGLYSTTDARLQSVGSPLTNAMCINPIYCDPSKSFEEIMKIPEDAAYTSLQGSCASVVDSEVQAYTPDGIKPPESESSSSIVALTPSIVCMTTVSLTLLARSLFL